MIFFFSVMYQFPFCVSLKKKKDNCGGSLGNQSLGDIKEYLIDTANM